MKFEQRIKPIVVKTNLGVIHSRIVLLSYIFYVWGKAYMTSQELWRNPRRTNTTTLAQSGAKMIGARKVVAGLGLLALSPLLSSV